MRDCINQWFVLVRLFAPSVKKRPDRLYKPTAVDILVFLKIVKMNYFELKELFWIIYLEYWMAVFNVNLFGDLGSFLQTFPATSKR